MPESILKKNRIPLRICQGGESAEARNDENSVRRRSADYDTISFAEMSFSSSGDIEENPRQLNSFAQFLDLTAVLHLMVGSYFPPSGLSAIDAKLSHLLLACGLFETL